MSLEANNATRRLCCDNIICQRVVLGVKVLQYLGHDVQQGSREERPRSEQEGVREADALGQSLIDHHQESREAAPRTEGGEEKDEENEEGRQRA